jgi:high affinity Mn2+ porin
MSFVRALAICLLSSVAWAANPEQPETAPKATDLTFLDHDHMPKGIWLGAEINSIFQYHPSFTAPYSGPNSLVPDSEWALSGLMTVFGAYRPHKTTEIILDFEVALGGGISKALGAAGFTNLDVVRNPALGTEPYIARLQIHQLIPLSREWEPNSDRGPISSFDYVPRHRLEIRVGKLSTADLFDVNPAGSDSHMQFMNWAVDNNGAYDYAADTRGYTYGFIVEYQGPIVEARFGLMLMPTVANGIDLDWDLGNSSAQNLELELKYSRRNNWRGTVRLLGYANRANMGDYGEANAAFLAGLDARPDITAHRHPGNTKYGVGVNVIQELGDNARAFARGGWNDGHAESFAYTEIDDTFEIGADLAGPWWRRPNDKIGLAFVTNGISPGHRRYLQLGGLGFLLGDGNLRYGRENIVELYYNLQVYRGAFLAGDFQYLEHPGYNRDRGPVYVLSLRGHIEL